jgi:hypothetical protein
MKSSVSARSRVLAGGGDVDRQLLMAETVAA